MIIVDDHRAVLAGYWYFTLVFSCTWCHTELNLSFTRVAFVYSMSTAVIMLYTATPVYLRNFLCIVFKLSTAKTIMSQQTWIKLRPLESHGQKSYAKFNVRCEYSTLYPDPQLQEEET